MSEKQFKKDLTGKELVLNQPSKYGFYCILSDHFHKGFCRNATYLVQILEKLKESGSSARNALEASIIYSREQCEKTWMLKLRKLYP